MSIPVEIPADVHRLPFATNRDSASIETSGNSASAAQLAQWVATRALLSMPSEASTKAPEHIEPKRCAVRAHVGSHFCASGCAAARIMVAVSPPATSRVWTLLGLSLASASVCRTTPQLLATKPPRGDTTTILQASCRPKVL